MENKTLFLFSIVYFVTFADVKIDVLYIRFCVSKRRILKRFVRRQKADFVYGIIKYFKEALNSFKFSYKLPILYANIRV